MRTIQWFDADFTRSFYEKMGHTCEEVGKEAVQCQATKQYDDVI